MAKKSLGWFKVDLLKANASFYKQFNQRSLYAALQTLKESIASPDNPGLFGGGEMINKSRRGEHLVNFEQIAVAEMEFQIGSLYFDKDAEGNLRSLTAQILLVGKHALDVYRRDKIKSGEWSLGARLIYSGKQNSSNKMVVKFITWDLCPQPKPQNFYIAENQNLTEMI